MSARPSNSHGFSTAPRWFAGWTLRDVPRAARLLGRAGGGERGRVRAGAAVVAVPGRQPRPPAADRAPVGGVLLAVAAAQRRLLVEAHEARHHEPEDRGVDEQHRAAEDRRLT